MWDKKLPLPREHKQSCAYSAPPTASLAPSARLFHFASKGFLVSQPLALRQLEITKKMPRPVHTKYIRSYQFAKRTKFLLDTRGWLPQRTPRGISHGTDSREVRPSSKLPVLPMMSSVPPAVLQQPHNVNIPRGGGRHPPSAIPQGTRGNEAQSATPHMFFPRAMWKYPSMPHLAAARKTGAAEQGDRGAKEEQRKRGTGLDKVI